MVNDAYGVFFLTCSVINTPLFSRLLISNYDVLILPELESRGAPSLSLDNRQNSNETMILYQFNMAIALDS